MTDDELARAVAERVLGWPKCVACGNIHAPHDYRRLPTLDAVAVIEAMLPRSWLVNIVRSSTDGTFAVQFIMTGAPVDAQDHDDASLPRAVALAALAAVDAERAE